MKEHLLFLTGSLAEKQLRSILEKMQPEFTYTVHQLGLKVAALMTTDMIARRLHETFGATKIILPGRCRGDIEALSEKLGIPVVRGTDEVKDLPTFFGKKVQIADLTRYSLKIFAEITDAPNLSVDEILGRASYYRQNGNFMTKDQLDAYKASMSPEGNSQYFTKPRYGSSTDPMYDQSNAM